MSEIVLTNPTVGEVLEGLLEALEHNAGVCDATAETAWAAGDWRAANEAWTAAAWYRRQAAQLLRKAP